MRKINFKVLFVFFIISVSLFEIYISNYSERIVMDPEIIVVVNESHLKDLMATLTMEYGF